MTTPAHPEDLRVGDAEREHVVELLTRAQAEGRLDLFEYDERLRAGWGARTSGELARVTADLPVGRPTPAAPLPQPTGRRRAARGAVATWAFASSVNLMIWAVVSVAGMSWVYPWWIWVAGPWGAVLLAGWLVDRVTGSPPERR